MATLLNRYVLFFLFVIMLVACGDAKEKAGDRDETVASEKEAASISFKSLQLYQLDGTPFDSTGLQGKIVFVNFWATWCKPCLAEMPSIDRAALGLADKNVIFIAASDERPERIKAFRDKSNYQFQIVATQADLSALGVFALPATFIFDTNGNLAFRETGAREWDSQQSIQLITETK